MKTTRFEWADGSKGGSDVALVNVKCVVFDDGKFVGEASCMGFGPGDVADTIGLVNVDSGCIVLFEFEDALVRRDEDEEQSETWGWKYVNEAKNFTLTVLND